MLRFFTTLDLKNGYFHVPVSEESQKYTAFVTPSHQYEFLKTPFGLSIAPAVFQKFINAVFRGLIKEGIVLAYMDDLIVVAKDLNEALDRFKRVIEVAQVHGLNIGWKKCKFLQEKIEYLDHVISKDKVQPTEAKCRAVKGFKMPTSVKEVQSFLGLTGYLRKFIPQYSRIAKPLSDLLRKNIKFHMGEEERNAVEKLKTALSTQPVLRIYRVSAETELHTDASCDGYGMMLMQKGDDDNLWHPVYYASGKTSPAEAKYSSYELEVLAVVKGLIKFRVYLLGIPFRIITDCQAFAMTMRKRDLSPRIARWALQLQEFQYEVCHRPGKSMQHVDALSRHPLPKIYVVKECQTSLLKRMEAAQKDDEDLAKLRKEISTGKTNGYAIKNELVHKEVKNDLLIVVPRLLQMQVIRQAHEQGHYGVAKTEALLLQNFWFKGMRPKIEKTIQNCLSCILAERKNGKKEGLIQPISKGDLPLDTYHIDHLGPMTATQKQYQHLFVVVDAFTKFTWLYPTRTTNATEAIEKLKQQAVTFGNPRRIISDRGAAFTSKNFADYCTEENIQHLTITTGIPRGNGQVERINRIIIPVLTKLAAPTPQNWYKYTNRVQSSLNNSTCRSTQRSPFHLLIGVEMRIKENLKIKEIIEEEWVEQFENERDDLRDAAKEAILRVQEENRKTSNKNRKEDDPYRINQLVAVRRTQFGPGLKIHAKYLGPYKVTKKLRHGRYLVEKVGEHEGPNSTSTASDSMKPWVNSQEDEFVSGDENETNVEDNEE